MDLLAPSSSASKARIPAWLAELRPHHWVKNVLVIVPLAADHQLLNLELEARVAMAFVAFSLCASGQYVLNDLLDLSADRVHSTKSRRPLAAGTLSRRAGVILMVLAWAGAALAAAPLGIAFGGVLAAYLVLMLVYSWRLKHIAILDAIALGAGYAARVAAGGVAVAIRPSAWLINFCVCLFFSLALVKRYGELAKNRNRDGPCAQARGYLGVDLPFVGMFGIASGYLAVWVLAMYLTNETPVRQIYDRPVFISLTGILLAYWISHLWLVANRGQLTDDPIVFALRDRLSRILVALMALCAWLAV
jgi:4-hydroxybenzoate polyprenyltransferase